MAKTNQCEILIKDFEDLEDRISTDGIAYLTKFAADYGESMANALCRETIIDLRTARRLLGEYKDLVGHLSAIENIING